MHSLLMTGSLLFFFMIFLLFFLRKKLFVIPNKNLRFKIITNPMGGRLSMGKAIFFVILIWCYTTPWALLPYFQVWGRFVPGDWILKIKYFPKNIKFKMKIPFRRGLLDIMLF